MNRLLRLGSVGLRVLLGAKHQVEMGFFRMISASQCNF